MTRSVLSALENFVTFSGKPDRLSLFLLMYWSSSRIYFKKGQLLQIISEVAVRNCSLKCSCLNHFTNFREIIRGRVILLAKNQKIIYFYGRCLDDFLKLFRAAFLTFSGDCFLRKKNLSEAAVRRCCLK